MADLGRQLFWGALYTALSKYSNILMTLFVTAVLSRLLTPEDFGMAALAMIALGLFQVVADMGISPAVVQKRDMSAQDLHTIYSLTIVGGLVLSALFFLLAWPIADYYKNSALRTLCHLLCPAVFFLAASTVPSAVLLKNKEFKFIALCSSTLHMASGVITILAALAGAGLYAILIAPVFMSALTFWVTIKKCPQTFSIRLKAVAVRSIFSYSAYQLLFNIINYFFRNTEKMLIGKFMTMDLLGLYVKSYSLMMLPVHNITHVITPALHPLFSEHQHDPSQLVRAYEMLVRFLAFVGFATSGFFFFAAKEIVLILLGEQWIGAVPVFQILSISIGLQTALASSGTVFQAFGDTRSLFGCAVVALGANITGVMVGITVFGTLEAIAYSLNITFVINFMVCYAVIYKKIFRRSLKFLAAQFVSPMLLGLFIACAMVAISRLVDQTPLFFALCAKGLGCLLVAAAYIQLTKEYDIIQNLRQVLHRRGAAAVPPVGEGSGQQARPNVDPPSRP